MGPVYPYDLHPCDLFIRELAAAVVDEYKANEEYKDMANRAPTPAIKDHLSMAAVDEHRHGDTWVLAILEIMTEGCPADYEYRPPSK